MTGDGREGLAIPPDVLAAGRQYMDDEDRVLQFLTDRQLANPGAWGAGGFIASGALYREFQQWMVENGHIPWSKTTFGKQLATGGTERYGLAPKRTSAQRGYEIERLLIDDEERAAALDRIAGGGGRLTVVGGHGGRRGSPE